MVLQKVKKYAARWDINGHRGLVSVLYDAKGGDWEHIIIKDPMEFFVVVDMLRNEKPVMYDDQKIHVMTSDEPVGEEEDLF
ncbi:MAG: hypothetical protein GF329_16845 [Candidatus Lokiarchaeota archaeon]|nr:hypothetical protein [Candidatus Lokiarchaeota archaeon]